MPDDEKPTQHIQIEMTRELIKRIDDYRFSRRFLSRAAAIRYLLEYALNERPDAPPQAD